MALTAKSVIFDIADGWLDNQYLGARAIDFWYEGSKIALPATDFTAYATSTAFDSDAFQPFLSFDTTTSKTGVKDYNQWMSGYGNITNQRLIIVFDVAQTFDEIRVNNAHHSGARTDEGMKTVVITASTDTITDTTYNASITNNTQIFSGQVAEHSATDTEDEQTLTLVLPAVLSASSGTYTITGTDASFNPFRVDSGSFIITGMPVTGTSRTMSADSGDYNLTSTDVILIAPLYAESGSYTITGTAAFDLSMSVASGAYTLTGFDTGLLTASITAEFPSLELNMFGGAFLQPELPMFEMDAIGFVGHNAELSLTFPSLSIESYAGGYVDVTMPSFEFVMEATITGLAEISLTFPALGFSISAEPASEGDIDISLPGLQLAMEATAGIVGELTLRFPRLGMTGTLLAGTTGQIEGSFRIMNMNMVASPTGPGTISIEFPMFDMDIISGSVESGILRYTRERIR